MDISRRDALRGLASIAAATSIPAVAPRAHAQQQAMGFPRRSDFRIADGYTYINGAYTHPMPIAAADAFHRAIDRRSTLAPAASPPPPRIDPRPVFAQLINAKASEISYIPNTSTGENLIVEALGIPRSGGNVVTDALHFEGALLHLSELKKQGLDVRVVMPRDGHIDLRDMERVIDNNTKLVEVSLVSMYNGFQHDIKAVCDLAHAHGALVYADIIQGVGAVPFDVRATNVDFAATSSYKWLMGDFGLGFLYVREDLLPRLTRVHWSYESALDTTFHMSPTDPQSPQPVAYTPGTDVARYFQLGTMASAVGAALEVSMRYIMTLGVASIQRHRQPMIAKLQAEMPRLGFAAQTPRDSTSPVVTFAHKDAATINRKLLAARVNVRVAEYWMRISPSVYNDLADIDRLLNALS